GARRAARRRGLGGPQPGAVGVGAGGVFARGVRQTARGDAGGGDRQPGRGGGGEAGDGREGTPGRGTVALAVAGRGGVLAGGGHSRQPHGRVTETIHVRNRASAGVPAAVPRGDAADLVAPRRPWHCPHRPGGGGLGGGRGDRGLLLRTVLGDPRRSAGRRDGRRGGTRRAVGRPPGPCLEPGPGGVRAGGAVPPARPAA